MAVVAGEAARLKLDVDVGGLRGSSGYKKLLDCSITCER
jgi:hypothetical protein